MKSLTIKPNILEGNVLIPPSKSISHRALIAAAMSTGETIVENINLCDDLYATIDGLRALGINIELDGSTAKVSGELHLHERVINCNESGSTIRFLIPLATLIGEEVLFSGKPSLISRPMTIYSDLFVDDFTKTKNGFLVNHQIKPGNFTIEGNISSQFITGLLFVLPLLEGDSNIIINEPYESKSYVDLTLDVLKSFGINIEFEDNIYRIKGNQSYKCDKYVVPSDDSQAAFFLVANAINSKITIDNLNEITKQGDAEIRDIIKENRKTINVSDCPDLVPILAVYGSLVESIEITHASRLRLKESDRLNAITTVLNTLGGNVEEYNDGLVVNKITSFIGGVVDSFNDHRIAMAVAIASIKCDDEITLTNPYVVSKSYENFWSDFQKLGGEIHE